MATSNEEKYLKSIDGTLKDILKELKRQGRTENTVVKAVVDAERLKKAQRAMQGYPGV